MRNTLSCKKTIVPRQNADDQLPAYHADSCIMLIRVREQHFPACTVCFPDAPMLGCFRKLLRAN